MSKSELCCDDCFSKLAKISTTAARVWMDLCRAQSKYGIFGLVSSDSTASIVLLERMGFIVTTDTKDYIILKVRQEFDIDGYFYCGGCCNG